MTRSHRVDALFRAAALVVALGFVSLITLDDGDPRREAVVLVVGLCGAICIFASGFVRDSRLVIGGTGGLLGGFVLADLSGGFPRSSSLFFGLLIFMVAELAFVSSSEQRGDDVAGVDRGRVVYLAAVLTATVSISVLSLAISFHPRSDLFLELMGIVAGLVAVVAIMTAALLPPRGDQGGSHALSSREMSTDPPEGQRS